jgi:hypothetical protein
MGSGIAMVLPTPEFRSLKADQAALDRCCQHSQNYAVSVRADASPGNG